MLKSHSACLGIPKAVRAPTKPLSVLRRPRRHLYPIHYRTTILQRRIRPCPQECVLIFGDRLAFVATILAFMAIRRAAVAILKKRGLEELHEAPLQEPCPRSGVVPVWV